MDLVISTCFKLSKYGYGVTFLGHSKYKNKKDQVTGIEVELLTSSLDNKYYNAIKDHVNFVGMAYYDVEFANVKVVKDVFSKGTKEVADEIKSKKRVICFRDDDFAMDTKSHFGLINEKCDFSADAIIETIYDAIKEEVKNELEIDEITDETLLEMQQEQFEDMMVEVSEMIEVEQREENIKNAQNEREDMLSFIMNNSKNIKSESMTKIRQILKNSGKAGLSELTDKDLKEVYVLAQDLN